MTSELSWDGFSYFINGIVKSCEIQKKKRTKEAKESFLRYKFYSGDR